MDFGESISATAAISAILGTYPFSIGLLREVLQNSDDAGASKQIFLLDTRTHPSKTLLDPRLADYQGPALLAYNNATFNDEDWIALQRIHQSSKKTDTNKIGKYGIGFRSCYHITDHPQILSGDGLALLDPHQDIFPSGGKKVDIIHDHSTVSNHIAAFNIDALHSSHKPLQNLEASIIRLPLRQDGHQSEISKKVVTCDEIEKLLSDFVNEEIGIAMLFLSHISSIEIRVVGDLGTRCLGRAEITRTAANSGNDTTTRREICAVTMSSGSTSTPSRSQSWEILHYMSSIDRAAATLSERLGYDTTLQLKREKLNSTVALALRVPLVRGGQQGRLFTFLPLPLPTGFPLHVHALFALTQARQNLWNGSEKGMVKGTRDELLIAWNQILFDTYIPEAWAELLLQLSRSNLSRCEDIFLAWPPKSQDTPGGDPAYWQPLARSLLRVVADRQLRIWPLVGGANIPTFGSFEFTLFASSDSTKYTFSLASAGIQISQPPEYILDMIRDNKGCQNLTPQAARTALLRNLAPVSQLSSQARQVVLEYLLSTHDVTGIAGVPIICLMDGSLIALGLKTHSQNPHILLRGDEVDVFASCDRRTIDLSQIPTVHQSWFYGVAARTLDVNLLDTPCIVQYVSNVLDRFQSNASAGMAPKQLVEWLHTFWTWVGMRQDHPIITSALGNLSLIINTRNQLRPLSSTIFRTEGLSNRARAILEGLGANFLGAEFPGSSIHVLEGKGALHSPHNLRMILDVIDVPEGAMSDQAVQTLQLYLTSALDGVRQALDSRHREVLRRLPIYPTFFASVHSTSIGSERKIGSLPQGQSIQCFSTQTLKVLQCDSGVLLPLLPNTIFVSRTYEGIDCARLISLLDPTAKSNVTEVNIITSFVANFASQSKPNQSAFLRSLARHIRTIPPYILMDLQSTSFLPVGTGSLTRSPSQVIDPTCELAMLFAPNDANLPRILDVNDKTVVDSLRLLGLMRTQLAKDVIKERISHVSLSSSGADISTQLLRLLEKTRFDCTDLANDFKASWLPTSKGLRSPQQCRDHGVNRPRALFDRVLDVLEVGGMKITSPSLRCALGWDQEIPLDVIKEQFRRVLEASDAPDKYDLLNILLPELGRRLRAIRGTPVEVELRQITTERPWIPIVPNIITTTCMALLDRPPPGFYLIPSRLTADESTVGLLKLLGCSEYPSNAAILQILHQPGSLLYTNNALNVIQVVRLLKAIDPKALSMEERNRILVPDNESILRTWEKVYFNDLGAHIYSVDSELLDGRHAVHSEISGKLAAQLGIQTLRSLNLKAYDVDDDDMGEDVTTRISNVLRQYSIQQAFNEFLANASDAGATQFDILIDEQEFKADNILTSAMHTLQSSPALVLHNDGVFKASDFKGIRQVGLGGKQERTDAIGKFGLGALSMFHFAEVAMIISGEFVQFLDPSRRFLPLNGHRERRSLLIPLKALRQHNRDHLAPFNGLYGFDANSDDYKGTLFRLPLRSRTEAPRSPMSKTPISAFDVRALVDEYKSIAPSSLIFIKVQSITASTRHFGGSVTPTWSTIASRQTPPPDLSGSGYTTQLVTISIPNSFSNETWHVVSEQATIDSLPDEHKLLSTVHKLRHVSVAIAARTNLKRSKSGTIQHRLYSKLPLPTLTSLPVHIDGSFILADDRRSIRFEESGSLNPESRYNFWLLDKKVPQLYHFLLESWSNPLESIKLWPVARQSRGDGVARTVVDAFYASLVNSPRRLCVTLDGSRHLPANTVFVGTVGPGVERIAQVLGPSELATVPERIRTRVRESGVRHANAPYFISLLKRQTNVFKSGFSSGKFSVTDINDLLSFLQDDTSGDSLIGLPLLPLASSSLANLEGPTATPRYAFSSSKFDWRPWQLFPCHHFLHQDLNAKLVPGSKFNVVPFSGRQVGILVATVIPPSSSRQLSADEQAWLKEFWEHFDKFELPLDSVSTLPLVPTTIPGLHISLDQCRSDTVLRDPSGYYGLDPLDTDWLPSMLVQLGAQVVKVSECPRPLQQGLNSLSFSFESMLKFLTTLPCSNLPHLLTDTLSERDKPKFASYVLSQISRLRSGTMVGSKKKRYMKYTVNHQAVARCLPVWKAYKGDSYTFQAASDNQFKTLPASLSLAVIRPFLSKATYFVDHTVDLTNILDVTPLTLETIVSKYLNVPDILDTRQVTQFSDLLLRVLSMLPQTLLQNLPLPVPNTNMRMVSIGTLYADSEPLFRTVFRNNPELFLCPSLRPLEPRLAQFGLQKSVDFAAFRKCAQVVHQTPDPQMAAEVARWYNDHLWMRMGANVSQWRELDNIQFIPRSEVRRNYQDPAFSPQDYARPLPSVVSPSELLRAEHEAIGWTQRALFRDTPSAQLLIAHPTLGIPEASEVVKHLRCLVSAAAVNPFNRDLLSDLTETYRWLSSHISECRTSLLYHKGESLFLNVDDPNDALAWNFHPARQLLFDGLDEGDWRRVRVFLIPFRNLLLEVGAKQITAPKRPRLPASQAEQVNIAFRTSLNKQRQEQQLTDVTLISSDGNEFPAHRIILSASTEHFNIQFCRGWRESSSMSVDVDVSSGVLGLVLNYIYTGAFPEVFDQEDLLELLEVSDMWNLRDLFARVENYLIDTVTLGTVDDVYATADKFRAQQLVDACRKFKIDNAHAL